MARIKLYPNDTTIEGGDKLVGTDINGNATKNYQIEELAQYFEQTGNALFQYNFAGTYTSETIDTGEYRYQVCLLYTSPSPRDRQKSRMPSSA